MSVYARISGGVVVETWTAPAGQTPASCFTAAIAADFVAVPPGVAVAQGWSYDGTTFAAPAAAAPSLAQQAAAAIQGGLTLVSTGTPALNGVYPATTEARIDVMAEKESLLNGGTFTNGGTVFALSDNIGTLHTFDVSHFNAYAIGLGAWYGANKQVALTNAGTLAPQPLTIA